MPLRLRLHGGGSKEQADEPEEEAVVAGRAVKVREYKLLEDAGSRGRQTPFWICSECGNMLYPKEDAANRKLKRVCRNCGREDDADNNLVYVNDLHPQAHSQDSGAEMIKDPTLPHAVGVECTHCGHDEAVFFQAPMKGDAAMKLIFMCCKCVDAASPSRPGHTHTRSRARRPACSRWRCASLCARADVPTSGCNSARCAPRRRRGGRHVARETARRGVRRRDGTGRLTRVTARQG